MGIAQAVSRRRPPVRHRPRRGAPPIDPHVGPGSGGPAPLTLTGLPAVFDIRERPPG
jgi:hypothetical protein